MATCIEANTTPAQNGTIPFLEEDLQQGVTTEPEPAVAINSVPVFAAFTPENALAAACSAFTRAARPQECSEFGQDVCSAGQEGAVACSQGLLAGLGRTQCVVTESGFECGCGARQLCFESLNIPGSRESALTAAAACRCPAGTMQQALAGDGQNASDPNAFRCVATGQCVDGACGTDSICVPSMSGDIRCVPKREMCTEANNFGGCYVSEELGPNNERLHACVSLIDELQERAQEMPPVAEIREAPAFRCDCGRLPCHSGDGASCTRLCALDRCMNADRPDISTCAIGNSFGAQTSPLPLSPLCPAGLRCP